jgi:hypothetical protein
MEFKRNIDVIMKQKQSVLLFLLVYQLLGKSSIIVVNANPRRTPSPRISKRTSPGLSSKPTTPSYYSSDITRRSRVPSTYEGDRGYGRSGTRTSSRIDKTMDAVFTEENVSQALGCCFNLFSFCIARKSTGNDQQPQRPVAAADIPETIPAPVATITPHSTSPYKIEGEEKNVTLSPVVHGTDFTLEIPSPEKIEG